MIIGKAMVLIRMWWIVSIVAWGMVGSGCRSAAEEAAASEAETVTETAAEADGVAFTEVTTSAGLGDFRHMTGAAGKMWMPETVGGGGAFTDFDSDGWPDLLLVRGSGWTEEGAAPVDALALYRNNGDGTFTDRTVEAGLGGVQSYAFGVTPADYDNDGDEDLYVTSLRENMLFRNDDGRFVDVSREAGVSGPPEWSTAAVFFDADLDGNLDLYVGNYVIWSPDIDIRCSMGTGIRSYCTPDAYEGLGGRFYRNEGNGTFSDRTDEFGFGGPLPGKTLAATTLDYDADGDADLVVVNDTERDLLYRNDGGGTFEEVGVISGIAFDRYGKARAGMGVDVGVVDSTGRPAVFIANFTREMVGVYQYTGSGRFVDRALQTGIGQASVSYLTFGLFVFDADLDGDIDLVTANGHISPEIEAVEESITYRQPVRMYRNAGDGTFSAVENAFVGEDGAAAFVGRGAAYGDYDRDGDLDVLIVENGGPAHLWRNDMGGRNFLRVRLEGRESNRDGIGSQIDVFAAGKRMTRFVTSGTSFLSAPERVATFGLGRLGGVDSVVVRWPSGRVDRFGEADANREIRLVEGEDAERGNRLVERDSAMRGSRLMEGEDANREAMLPIEKVRRPSESVKAGAAL